MSPNDHTGIGDPDALPHLDYVSETPTVLVLGGRGALTVKYNVDYDFMGDSTDGGSLTRYVGAVKDTNPMWSKQGVMYVADARRALHHQKVLTPGHKATTQTLLRAFIYPIDQ